MGGKDYKTQPGSRWGCSLWAKPGWWRSWALVLWGTQAKALGIVCSMACVWRPMLPLGLALKGLGLNSQMEGLGRGGQMPGSYSCLAVAVPAAHTALLPSWPDTCAASVNSGPA